MKNQYQTLVKREFWEHRSLWVAPAGAAGFLLLTALVGVMFALGAMMCSTWNVITVSLRQTIIPARLLGRRG